MATKISRKEYGKLYHEIENKYGDCTDKYGEFDPFAARCKSRDLEALCNNYDVIDDDYFEKLKQSQTPITQGILRDSYNNQSDIPDFLRFDDEIEDDDILV